MQFTHAIYETPALNFSPAFAATIYATLQSIASRQA